MASTRKVCCSLTSINDAITEVGFRTVELSNPAYEHEGLRFVTVKSSALGRRADCTVWEPLSHKGEAQQEVGTLLILLHGVYGSAWSGHSVTQSGSSQNGTTNDRQGRDQSCSDRYAER